MISGDQEEGGTALDGCRSCRDGRNLALGIKPCSLLNVAFNLKVMLLDALHGQNCAGLITSENCHQEEYQKV